MQVLIEMLEDRQLFSYTVLPLHVKPLNYVSGSRTFSAVNLKASNWQTTEVTVGAGASAPITDGVSFGFHGNNRAVFSPAKDGSITSLDFSETSRLGKGQRTGPALEQNGRMYFLLDQALGAPSTKWIKSKVTALTAADFVTADTGAHPDFSQTAAPIELGFFQAVSSGDAGKSIVTKVEDWSVKVHTRKLASTPPQSAKIFVNHAEAYVA